MSVTNPLSARQSWVFGLQTTWWRNKARCGGWVRAGGIGGRIPLRKYVNSWSSAELPLSLGGQTRLQKFNSRRNKIRPLRRQGSLIPRASRLPNVCLPSHLYALYHHLHPHLLESCRSMIIRLPLCTHRAKLPLLWSVSLASLRSERPLA